eukprot:CAMPEP_0175069796 /NCGR_PEP_ID=MMETSP0052_2-20121109/18380_1 /TAXON_ID=51329 ORGANISM="Polytomella parva, Strain SAG 63-3" /NCGR_SAMPLE_ID=MMETSP0052_2 /ASSEMBLY_ACC=CAM_ASM_000194 /LENGTH=134 /DNA_ID=CAMNT_0016336883 /DNA_START=31 /DNA_END=435 /DNA_ORIENTATION=-
MISSVRLRGTPQTPLQVQGTKFKKTRSIVKGSNAQLILKRSLLFAFEASTQTPPPMSCSQNQIMKIASQEPGQQSPDPPDHSSFDFSFGCPLPSTEGNRFSSGLDDLSENLTSMSLISGKYNKTSGWKLFVDIN